ncbi:MAG TPA: hypothetical protein VN903_00675 [Polyangia bacterium]|jgi:uncharacterized protein YbaR (Trm112 family)|nr:hypothetical protein [Polyangia bacterium]
MTLQLSAVLPRFARAVAALPRAPAAERQYRSATNMQRSIHLLRAVLAFALVVSCKTNDGATSKVLVPKGFDVSLLEILACPENLSTVRLATAAEVEAIRTRVAKGSVHYRDGRTPSSAFEGILIRADGRVGYTITGGVADMMPENGLALDPTVGPADPSKYRR